MLVDTHDHERLGPDGARDGPVPPPAGAADGPAPASDVAHVVDVVDVADAGPGALPAALRVELRTAWEARAGDRWTIVPIAMRCATWLRERGASPERALVAVKCELSIHRLPLTEQPSAMVARDVVLRMTLAAYFGLLEPPLADAAAEELARPWTEIARRSATPHPARLTARRLRDDRGVEWRVYERTDRRGARTPSAPPAACLVFDRETCVRCRRHYPADWRELPDAALRELLERADG